MNFFKILNEKEKAEVLRKLNNQFGITEIPGKILQRGAERLFLFSGSFSDKQIQELEQIIPIERIGNYFAKITETKELRLSVDGIHMLKNQITRNIFELDDEQAKEWLKGNELLVKTPESQRNFVVVKYKDEFLGTGKASAEKISNFLPKNRRLKEKN